MPGMSLNLFRLSATTCCTCWAGLYLTLAFLAGLPYIAFHAIGIGLLLGLLTYFRLPPPQPPGSAAITRMLAAGAAGDLPAIAHRAAGLDAPENTVEALRLCKKNGAECVEFDVSFTRNLDAVVFHDDSLDRVTGQEGLIEDKTLVEVQKLDAAATHVFKDTFSPCRIPTLDEFVDECLELDLNMMIDLKTWKRPRQTADLICNLFRSKPDLYSRALVTTFFPHLAYLIRMRDPKIVMAMAWRPHFISYDSWNGESDFKLKGKRRFKSTLQHWSAVLGDLVLRWAYHDWLWHFIGLSAVLVHRDVLTKDYVDTWRAKGVPVVAWTVNDSLQRAYLEGHLGVATMSDTMDRVPVAELVKTKSQ